MENYLKQLNTMLDENRCRYWCGKNDNERTKVMTERERSQIIAERRRVERIVYNTKLIMSKF